MTRKSTRRAAPKSPRKIPVQATIQVKAYNVLADAVESGIAAGWMHAHEHNSKPGENAICGAIYEDVTNAICEVFDFEQPGDE